MQTRRRSQLDKKIGSDHLTAHVSNCEVGKEKRNRIAVPTEKKLLGRLVTPS